MGQENNMVRFFVARNLFRTVWYMLIAGSDTKQQCRQIIGNQGN